MASSALAAMPAQCHSTSTLLEHSLAWSAIPVLLVGLMLPQAPASAVDEPLSIQQSSSQSQPQDKKPDDVQEKKPPTPPHTGVRALLDGLKEDVGHLPSNPDLY